MEAKTYYVYMTLGNEGKIQKTTTQITAKTIDEATDEFLYQLKEMYCNTLSYYGDILNPETSAIREVSDCADETPLYYITSSAKPPAELFIDVR